MQVNEAVIPIYVWPVGADLSALKEAVLSAKLNFKVKPFWYSHGVAQKCVVLGEPEGLPITVDYVIPKSSSALLCSVKWFYNIGDTKPKVVHTAASQLSETFGYEVKEIHDNN